MRISVGNEKKRWVKSRILSEIIQNRPRATIQEN